MPKSVYIHIPFCKSKCHYCSFISYPKLELKTKYLKTLEHEINSVYSKETLNTIYFGGGTPSLLEPNEFDSLIKHFNITNSTEITAELNPDGINSKGLDTKYLHNLHSIGINRISLGAQSFDDEILAQINRRHNSKQIFQAVENSQNSGFENISLDFIYGLPNQSKKMFLNDLKTAVNLGINHISLYGLTIEEGCYFYENYPQNLPDDNVQADMYIEAVEILTSSGFKHYEISNFAKEKFESKHNLNYWNNEEYYGFGVAAHGYLNGVRYGNIIVIEDYIKNPFKHNEERIESENDKLEEEIFLGFRKMDGINITKINSKYGINFEEKYSKILKKYVNLKLLKKTPKGYKFTVRGALVSNTILAEFLE